MPLGLGLVIVFLVGFWSGMAWIRASREDSCDRLCATIAKLRAELAHERLKTLAKWLDES